MPFLYNRAMIMSVRELWEFTERYIREHQTELDAINPAKAGWKHRIVSRPWMDRQEADNCLIWIIQTYGRGAGGSGPSSGKLWDGQFIRMADEVCSRVVFFTDDDMIAAAFSEQWGDIDRHRSILMMSPSSSGTSRGTKTPPQSTNKQWN